MTETGDPGPVVQRILLGADLRDAREQAGLSTAEATKAIGWYAGKLSRIESGDAKLFDKDLAKMVRAYSIPSDRAERLQSLAADARRRLPPSRVPDWAVKYVNLLAAATDVKIFNADTFPGTVQTVDYARATLSQSVIVSPADVDGMAQERARRVERFRTPNAPRLWVVVGEEALHREIGGKDVLRAQIEQVRGLAALPNVTVQVIPFVNGAHASHGVAFTMITLLDGRPGVVYVEGLTGSDYLAREHFRIYGLVYDNLRGNALSMRGTMAMIDQRLAEL
jgi:transcriptional regulator with XRE-family HTH domain